MRISEVSRRSGISATALRYYGSIGLVTPQRSSNGYRDYDAATLHRPDLIEASKELGLPLADVSRHLVSLEVDSCTDVREQLRPLIAERAGQIDEKRARLDVLRARLTGANRGLAECLDVGEGEHHAVAIDRAGECLFDKALPNDEGKLCALTDGVKEPGALLFVVDQPATIGASTLPGTEQDPETGLVPVSLRSAQRPGFAVVLRPETRARQVPQLSPHRSREMKLRRPLCSAPRRHHLQPPLVLAA